MNRSFLLFSILIAIAIVIAYLMNKYILTEDAYFYYLQNQVSSDQISNFLELRREWLWVGYAVIPLIYLAKISIITFCILTGALLFNHKTNFKTLFSACVKAEYVFLFPSMLTLIWFSVIYYDPDIRELESFYPLSIINFFDIEALPIWFKYPLSVLNIFEVLYVLVLSYNVSEEFGGGFASSLKVVSISYGSGLAIWILTVMFFTLNL